MLGPIAIDLGRHQWKVLQLVRKGKHLRVLDAMTIPTQEFPETWNCDEPTRSGDDFESRMIVRMRHLCSDLRGDTCVLVFPEEDCRYETYSESESDGGDNDKDRDPDAYHWALCLTPTSSPATRLGDGLYIGARTTVIHQWQRRLSRAGLALEGVLCPLQLAASVQSSEDLSLTASLLDDTQGGRIVIHSGGQPVFTRRLRVARPQPAMVAAGANGETFNAWSSLSESIDLQPQVVGHIASEVRRTLDFVKSKTGESIRTCVVHGALGGNIAACQRLAQSLSLSVTPWNFPDGTRVPEGVESHPSLYSLAFAAAGSRWELS